MLAQLMVDWFVLQDGDGFYYWHISSGTIQRDPPPRDNTANMVR